MITEVGYQAVNQSDQSTSQSQISTKEQAKGVHISAATL